MKFSQLRSFHAVATTGSFTAASNKLHISQPTITAQVRELENHYNVQLFRRRRSNNQLTETGQALLQVSRMMLELERKAKEILTHEGKLVTGTLRVGAVAPFYLMEILAVFNEQYPGIKVVVETGGSDFITEKVLKGELDVGMIAYLEPDKRLTTLKYREQGLVLMVPNNSPLANSPEIKLEDLNGINLIYREPGSSTRKLYEQAFHQRQIKPKVVMEISSREGVREAVVQGLGSAFVAVSEYQPHRNIRAVNVSDMTLMSNSYVICANAQKDTPVTRAFIESAILSNPEANPKANPEIISN
ncbi:LysR substrate-binding domain-containing protein [Endozoicomonas arenosclerae]|uniref:LysR substrate-binding domain-containing protein n=1 Tax=Endozoicomonas arenosclerae TaxID=1633495 RepID=UPI000782CD2F|nr:LysR substrate-binding domain-containing protein [Endozoicomonas arenosclerae]